MKFSVLYKGIPVVLCELQPDAFKQVCQFEVYAVPAYFSVLDDGIEAWPRPADSFYATAWESTAGYYWRIAQDGKMRMIVPMERLFDK